MHWTDIADTLFVLLAIAVWATLAIVGVCAILY